MAFPRWPSICTSKEPGIQIFLPDFLARGNDTVKIAGSLVKNLTDPETSHSQEPTKAPVQRVYNIDLPYHTLLQRPENTLTLRRLHIGLSSLTGVVSGDLPSGGS